MKKYLLVLFALSFFGCSVFKSATDNSEHIIKYHIDLTELDDDLFHVTVFPGELDEENNIYNFASTAPGTYTNLNFGRFVKSFNAFDKNGNEISVKNISLNRWEISDPENVAKVVYQIEDSFDAEGEKIFPMGGTGIEEDCVVLNTFGVCGYFEGMQSNPVKLKLDYYATWTLGSALREGKDGYFFAETYDHLSDSPFMLGELTKAATKVGDVEVEVFVYADDTTITADRIMGMADEMLQSADEFIGYAPVENYAFLFYLPDMATYQRNGLYGGGALEHNVSSLYVMPGDQQSLGVLRTTMAHEFLHILTPLNLHSEIIHEFNFVVPTPSEHLWLYEGITEWASNIMQLRSGLWDHTTYLRDISSKMRTNDGHDPDYSLSAMSLESYTPKGNEAFINFYNKGALTSTILDLRLLELSGGKRGLREVFLELVADYGRYKAFSEDDFFNVFINKTYPEIEDFINRYIRGAEALPIVEYFSKLGFNYTASKPSESKTPTFGTNIGMNPKSEIIAADVGPEMVEYGLRDNDVILSVFGIEMSMQTAQQIVVKARGMNIGDEYEMVVNRDGEEIVLNPKLLRRTSRHVFEEMETLSSDQKTLREAWSKNL